MKRIENHKEFEKLSLEELALLKGGDDRKYYVIIIDGKPTKVYI